MSSSKRVLLATVSSSSRASAQIGCSARSALDTLMLLSGVRASWLVVASQSWRLRSAFLASEMSFSTPYQRAPTKVNFDSSHRGGPSRAGPVMQRSTSLPNAGRPVAMLS